MELYAIMTDFALNGDLPKPKKKRPAAPRAEDPRHHAITSQIGDVYREAMKEAPAFNASFWKALSGFLAGWQGTADEWLDRYYEVLHYSRQTFATFCRKAAQPEFLCRNWMAVAAEIQKLKADEARANQPRRR